MVVLKMRKPKQGQRDTRKGYVEFYRNEQKTILLGWKIKLILLWTTTICSRFEGIDATPMEGFDRDTINQEFGLAEKGLKASVIVSLGYRSENDFNAKLPKSRLPDQVVFTRL
jgi:nitroreductase/dihydropteridine reductase